MTVAETLDAVALERLAALEQQVTPAPWGVTRYAGGFDFTGPERVYAGTDERYGEPRGIPASDGDARFIVALRNAAPALLRLARAGLAAERIAAIDPALLDRLAQRYGRSPGVDPRCPVCGEPMEADDGANPRPYREWWWRCSTHRDRATVTPPFPRPDEDVLSLVAAIRGEGATDVK